MLSLYNKHYICIVHYHSQFPIIKRTEGLSADSLILVCQVIFAEYPLPKKILLDAGINFVSDKIKNFYTALHTEQAVSSLQHQQSNWQVEACIQFKQILKKYFDTNTDTNLAFLQIRTTPLVPVLPCPVMLLFYYL